MHASVVDLGELAQIAEVFQSQSIELFLIEGLRLSEYAALGGNLECLGHAASQNLDDVLERDLCGHHVSVSNDVIVYTHFSTLIEVLVAPCLASCCEGNRAFELFDTSFEDHD